MRRSLFNTGLRRRYVSMRKMGKKSKGLIILLVIAMIVAMSVIACKQYEHAKSAAYYESLRN